MGNLDPIIRAEKLYTILMDAIKYKPFLSNRNDVIELQQKLNLLQHGEGDPNELGQLSALVLKFFNMEEKKD